jgi:Na+/glutamate symporter
MDYLLPLVLGMLLGGLLMRYWYTIQGHWQKSQNAQRDHDKTVKEILEMRKKASNARRTARASGLQASTELLFLVLLLLLLGIVVVNLLDLL